MSTAPKPRSGRVRSPGGIPYYGHGGTRPGQRRSSVEDPTLPAASEAGPNGEEVLIPTPEAAMVLGQAAARAKAAEDLEVRARQFEEDEAEESGLDKSAIGRAFRGIFGKFILSPRMVRLAKQRAVEDPAFHIRMIDKVVPTPQAARSDDSNGTRPVVLVLGAGMQLQYGAQSGSPGGLTEVIEAQAVETAQVEEAPAPPRENEKSAAPTAQESDGGFTDGEDR